MVRQTDLIGRTIGARFYFIEAGPILEEYASRYQLNEAAVVWSRCDGARNVREIAAEFQRALARSRRLSVATFGFFGNPC